MYSSTDYKKMKEKKLLDDLKANSDVVVPYFICAGRAKSTLKNFPLLKTISEDLFQLKYPKCQLSGQEFLSSTISLIAPLKYLLL